MSDSELASGLADLIERFDHVSVGVYDIAESQSLVGLMGGELIDGGDYLPGAFRWAQFRLPGGSKLEMIQPLEGAGPDHFLARFLETSGEGMHHVTFKVTDIEAAIARAEALGFGVVGIDLSQRNWKEAFVHPKTASGVLVQLAEWEDMPDRTDFTIEDVVSGVPDRYL